MYESFILFRIQRIWRGHLTRKNIRKQRQEELMFIGMVGIYSSCVSNVYVVYEKRLPCKYRHLSKENKMKLKIVLSHFSSLFKRFDY